MHTHSKLEVPPGAPMPERARPAANRHTAKPPHTPARVEEARLPLSRVDTNAPSKPKGKDLRRAVLTDPSRVGKPPRKKAALPRRHGGQEQVVDSFSLPRALTGRRKADALDDDDEEEEETKVQPHLRAPDIVPRSPKAKTKTKRLKVDDEAHADVRQGVAKLNLNSPVKPRRRVHRESKVAKEYKEFKKRMSKIPIAPQPDIIYAFPDIVPTAPMQQVATSSAAPMQSGSASARHRTKQSKEPLIPRCILPATKIKGLFKPNTAGRILLNVGPQRRGWKTARHGGDPYLQSFETARSKSLRSAPREHHLAIPRTFSERFEAVTGMANSLVEAGHRRLRHGLPAEIFEAVGLDVPIEVEDEDDDMNYFTPSSSMHTISMAGSDSSVASLMSWREATPEAVEVALGRLGCVAQYDGRIPHFEEEEAVAPELSMADEEEEVWYDASDVGFSAPPQVQQPAQLQQLVQVHPQPAQVQLHHAEIEHQSSIPLPTTEQARLAVEADNLLAELSVQLAAAGAVPATPTRPRVPAALLPVPSCPIKMTQRLYEDILAVNGAVVQRDDTEAADENPFIVQPVIATAGPSTHGQQDLFGVSDDEEDEEDDEEADEEDEDEEEEEFFDAIGSGEGIAHLKYSAVPGPSSRPQQ